MRKDLYFSSCGAGKIHVCRWEPSEEPRGVVQIIHGIAEHVERYDDFARYLNGLGFLVVAEDHMGHGKSASPEAPQGYFTGGWFSAVADSYRLLYDTRREFAKLPYILFGHSMGSFMARTILEKYPDSGITACIICGTGWQPGAVLSVGLGICSIACKRADEKLPSPSLEKLVFGGYNRRVEHPRTPYDWLTRVDRVVDDYMADPLCGFSASAGLLRDMLTGIAYIQKTENLKRMKKDLPVLFIAGGDDPVGSYGSGVRKAAEMFRRVGMARVDVRIYPMCRHEILNEVNRRDIYSDVSGWMETILVK